MTRPITDDAAEVKEAGEPAQGVTLSIPTHMAAPSHALVLREGPKPTRPRGRIPRVARLLALAYHFQGLLDTRVVETQAELAELAKLTPARVTQIMNLLYLAPDIQEEIFFLPPVTEGRPAVTERQLRQVLKTVVWSEQRNSGKPFGACSSRTDRLTGCPGGLCPPIDESAVKTRRSNFRTLRRRCLDVLQQRALLDHVRRLMRRRVEGGRLPSCPGLQGRTGKQDGTR